MAQGLYALVLLFFLGVEAFQVDLQNEYVPWTRYRNYRARRMSTTSDFTFSFDKRGFFGKVTFDIDIVVPPELMSRNITNIDVRFDPTSDLDAKVSVTRGGLGYDFATLHFQSDADAGKMHVYVILESR
ncbi:uncharacterized protein [Halyomorpha halys]|uniref:uncharacterized protein n=1 Tax=Halyomorpha halys TaxID=286706 RepID=UPI0006D516D0|nr:uncharacterized protein LOC106681730 [Halyomorpha halys]